MRNFNETKQGIIQQSLVFADYNTANKKQYKEVMPDSSLLSESSLSNSDLSDNQRKMFEYLKKMLEESNKKYQELNSKKEELTKYLERREKLVVGMDIFSFGVLYYFLINAIQGSLVFLGASLLSLGVVGAVLLNPITAIVAFFGVCGALFYRYQNKPLEERKKSIIQVEDDLQELEEEIDELAKHIFLLEKEAVSNQEAFSENLLQNENIASADDTELNSPIVSTTFFAIGNVTSTIGLLTSTLSSYGLSLPTRLLSVLNHIAGMTVITKDFVNIVGVNPFYALVFLSVYAPVKVYDYNKYAKHHKSIGEEILSTKAKMQQIDFITKLNESLKILNRINLKINGNEDLHKKLKNVSDDFKTSIDSKIPNFSNDLKDKLNASIFKKIVADYSNLSKLESVSTFFHLTGNKIKSLFMSKKHINMIDNLSDSIAKKMSTIDAINNLKPDDITEKDFERSENISNLVIKRLNERLDKVSKGQSNNNNIDDFVENFEKLINNHYDNFFGNFSDHEINTKNIITTYLSYINNSKLKILFDAVENPKSLQIQNLSGFLPEIMHVVEQELNLTIAYKTSRVIEYNFEKEYEKECKNHADSNPSSTPKLN